MRSRHKKGPAVQMTRTFLAVECSLEVRPRATELISALAQCPVNVKWVEPENLHLTIKFLGEVSDVDLPPICSAVTEAVATFPAFDAQCRGVGAFPHAGRPRTIWIGIEEGLAEFIELHERIDRCLAKLQFPRERRRFHPHLTVGRVRDRRDTSPLGEYLQERSEIRLGVLCVSEVVLFSSQLTAAGPIYSPLARCALNLT